VQCSAVHMGNGVLAFFASYEERGAQTFNSKVHE
jgi:hypothetical protein